jgi:hypothetical protein
MTTRVIEAGSVPASGSRQRQRSLPTVEPSVLMAIRSTAAAVLFVIALCGMVAFASFAEAGTTPPEGPVARLDH